jgi:plastocyanin
MTKWPLAVRRGLPALLAACLLSAPSSAADLRVVVRDEVGAPVPDAVVLLEGIKGPAAPKAGSTLVDQKDEVFTPYVQVIRAGASVTFRNSDETRHHVFSFSPARPLETQLNPGQSSDAMPFDKAGVVALGCNIHDSMVAYVYVADSAHFAVTDAEGRATLAGAPDGQHTLRVWSPRLRPGAAEPTQPVTVAAGAAAEVTLKGLLPDSRPDPSQSRY